MYIHANYFFLHAYAFISFFRPETWDHAALSDSRDAIRHIRKTVGKSVPMLGVGFSFGGCMLTAIAGSVPQEEHGLCGLVSISGLFDMSAMMTHIAEQYAYPYGFANTRVSLCCSWWGGWMYISFTYGRDTGVVQTKPNQTMGQRRMGRSIDV